FAVPDLVPVGNLEERLPNTLTVLFPRVSGREILQACPRVLASTGSACHAGRDEASPILTALGIPSEVALGAVRLSLGRATTQDDVEAAASSLASAWRLVQKTTVTENRSARRRTSRTPRSGEVAGTQRRKTAGGRR